jgi:preprotein translocase subunit YajC
MIILLYLVLLAAAFFLLVVRPQRRQLAARRELVASLQVGDEVITAGGIYGTIVAMDDRVVTLQVADGVELRLAREAVSSRPAPEVDLTDDDADETAQPAPTDPPGGSSPAEG